MEKLAALWKLFHAGEQVEDPAKWKNRQITSTILGGLFMAVVKVIDAFGYQLPIDENGCIAVAGGVLVLVNVVFTITTSKTVGLSSGSASPDETNPGP